MDVVHVAGAVARREARGIWPGGEREVWDILYSQNSGQNYADAAVEVSGVAVGLGTTLNGRDIDHHAEVGMAWSRYCGGSPSKQGVWQRVFLYGQDLIDTSSSSSSSSSSSFVNNV